MVLIFPFYDPTLLSFDEAGHNPSPENTPIREPNHTFTHTDTDSTLHVELPGVSRENTFVEVAGNKLHVLGKRFQPPSPAAEGSDGKRRRSASPERLPPRKRCELVYRFESKLDSMVDKAKISVVQEDGVLTVHLPMREDAKRHKKAHSI